MDHILTLIGDIDTALVSRLCKELGGQAPDWLAKGRACDIAIPAEVSRETSQMLLNKEKVDFIIQPKAHRQKKLLAADMDSTIILEESIDLLAAYAGCGDEVAAITRQAMRGEIDFAAALTARAALFAGVDAQVFDDVLAQINMRSGAQRLASVMRRHGAHCLLVSGGFEPIVKPIAERCGFAAAAANRLEIAGGRLTGRLIPPLRGAVDKKQALIDYADKLGLSMRQVIAIGDGANDVAMIKAAGLGVAIGDKPVLAPHVDMNLRHHDLTALLYIQGYRDFV